MARGVAQFGSAPLWGSGGRGFKSRRSDHLSSSFIRDLYSLYELMPTAMKVKDEKNTNTNIVRFETSTSPSWKDIKIFIRHYFLNHNIVAFLFAPNYKFRRITTPNNTRYIINNFKPFEEKYFNKKSIANKDDKNVVIRPINRGKRLYEKNSLEEEKNSAIAAKVIAGMPKRKENFAASPLSQPDTKAVEIVTPDLDTPGKIANAWESPIKKLSEKLWFSKFIELFFDLSAMYMKIAIKKETNAIDKLERSTLSKK